MRTIVSLIFGGKNLTHSYCIFLFRCFIDFSWWKLQAYHRFRFVFISWFSLAVLLGKCNKAQESKFFVSVLYLCSLLRLKAWGSTSLWWSVITGQKNHQCQLNRVREDKLTFTSPPRTFKSIKKKTTTCKNYLWACIYACVDSRFHLNKDSFVGPGLVIAVHILN